MRMQCKISFVLLLLIMFLVSTIGQAEEKEQASLWPVPDYMGSIWTRPALTGNWGGVRTKMADKGITVSVDIIQTYQNIIDGGREFGDVIGTRLGNAIINSTDLGIGRPKGTGGEFGGSVDYEIHFDFNKMGLMPGAFLRIFGETKFGDFIDSNTGALTAVNTDSLFPTIKDERTTLTGFVYYQFLSEWFALYLGKLDTLDGDANAFAGARGKDQFMNQNFVFNPVTLATVPYSALGGGALFVLPNNRGLFSFTALDPNGTAKKIGFDDAFDGGVVLTSELRIGVKPFGFQGHQLLGATWNSRDFTGLDQDFSRLFFEFLTTGAATLDEKEDSWSLYYNFDQYLYVEDEKTNQGVGIFGRFGWADKDTNPIENFYSVDVGGKGIIPGRDNDTFGIGYWYIDPSDKFPNPFNIIHRGKGAEIFYNFEITPWMHITPDFQIIDPGLRAVETNYIAGIRVKISL